MNALCLAPALRFNEPVVPDAIASLCACARSRATRRGGSRSSRGSAASSACATSAVPEEELAEVAAEAAQRPGARSNPRPATPADVEALLRSDLVSR